MPCRLIFWVLAPHAEQRAPSVSKHSRTSYLLGPTIPSTSTVTQIRQTRLDAVAFLILFIF